jgi:hypothetical protein
MGMAVVMAFVVMVVARVIVGLVPGIGCRLDRVRLRIAFERVSGAQSRLPSGLAASRSDCQGWTNGQGWLNKHKFKPETTLQANNRPMRDKVLGFASAKRLGESLLSW